VTKPRRRRSRGQLIESRAIAAELGALLERLDIDAVLTDRAGITLASTKHAAGNGHATATGTRRVVELRIHGQALCVAVALAVADGAVSTAPAELTRRQREVSTLIQEGLQNREIAERLGISLHTVRRHVEALLKRLDVPTRSSAAVLLRQVEHA
jgi:DNA-binding NarL/FixJ family response regulator